MQAELRMTLDRIDHLRRLAEDNYAQRTRRGADDCPPETRLALIDEANRIDAELDTLHNLT